MAEKMTRRTFMKGAAAAAAAISLSGVLVGCGGGSAAPDEVKLGAYTVKLYSANTHAEVQGTGGSAGSDSGKAASMPICGARPRQPLTRSFRASIICRPSRPWGRSWDSRLRT